MIKLFMHSGLHIVKEITIESGHFISHRFHFLQVRHIQLAGRTRMINHFVGSRVTTILSDGIQNILTDTKIASSK